MAAGGNSRPGGPRAASVVSVADLIARDAPWSGAPEAVDVTGGVPGIPAQRTSSGVTGKPARPAGRSGVVAAVASLAGPVRRLAAKAWSPNWRFITICAGVLVAGLLSNVVLLAAFTGPRFDSDAAGSEEGGYPSPEAIAEPPDLRVQPPAATLPGLGLPLALASLGQSVPAIATRTTPAAAAALVGTPSTTGSTLTGGTVSPRGTGGGGSTEAGGSAAGGVGGALGNTVSSVGDALPEPVRSPVRELGKTTKKATDAVGDTVDGLTGGLLSGGSPGSKADDADSGRSEQRSEQKSGSRDGDGGLLGSVGSLIGGN